MRIFFKVSKPLRCGEYLPGGIVGIFEVHVSEYHPIGIEEGLFKKYIRFPLIQENVLAK